MAYGLQSAQSMPASREQLEMMPIDPRFQMAQKELLYDDIVHAISKIDNDFNQNISLREPLNNDWIKHYEAAIDGQNRTEVTSLAQRYVNVGDNTFATNWRQASQRRMQLFDRQWFKCEPKGDFSSDTFLCNIKAAYMDNQLKNPNSNFYSAINDFDLQYGLLDISAIHYGYIVDIKRPKEKRLMTEGGLVKLDISEGEPEIRYQGGKATFVNMFNCYPNVLKSKSKYSQDWEIFYRESADFRKTLYNPLFDETKTYAYQDLVIYRSNQGLQRIQRAQTQYTKTQYEQRLEYKSQPRPTTGQIEVRSAYLDEFKVKNECFYDVSLVYAKHGSEIIPLLIEHNHLKYKPILIAINWSNPWDIYGKSQEQMTFNMHCYRAFLMAAMSYEVAKSVYAPQFVPAELMQKAMAAGAPPNMIQSALRLDPDGLGKIIQYAWQTQNEVGGSSMADQVWSPADIRSSKNIELIMSSINSLSAEMQNTSVDLKSADVNASTAAGVNFIQNQQAAAIKAHIKNISECILKPFLEMMGDDNSAYLFPEAFSLKLTPELKQRMEADPHYQMLKAQYGESFKYQSQITLPDGNVIPVEYNSVTDSLNMSVNRDLIKAIDSNIEILIENNDYDNQKVAEGLTVMSNLVASLPDQASDLKTQMSIDIAEQWMEIYQFPKRKEILARSQQLLQAVSQPNPLEQAQAAKEQAQAEKYSAQAKKDATEAQAQHLENEDKLMTREMGLDMSQEEEEKEANTSSP